MIVVANYTLSSIAMGESSAPEVYSRSFDGEHSGTTINETILTTANVNKSHFGKLFTRQLDGETYAQPLYVPNLTINGSQHNVIIVATEHNSVYAFDADDPRQAAPLWSVSLSIAPAIAAPVPNGDFGNANGTYLDIHTEVGITSTPIIDPQTNTLFVVAFTKDNPTAGPSVPGIYHHRLHALDLLTGAEKLGGSVVISGNVPGKTGVQGNGQLVTFNSAQELQRASLVLAAGSVYIAFASYADTYPFHGWIIGYDTTTLKQTGLFNVTPDGGGGGIWQSGQGLTVDPQGNLYVATGNGTFDADVGGRNYGDSFIKLDPRTGLTVLTWFTARDHEQLDRADLDVGSTGLLLIPNTNLVVGGSKQGKLFVTDRDHMGGLCATCTDDDTNIVQSWQVTSDGPIFGSPVYWTGPDGVGPLLYVWGEKDAIKAYHFDTAAQQFSTTPVAVGSPSLSRGYTGGILSVSANGTDRSTGIVWAVHQKDGTTAGAATVPGVLHAYDAITLKELWSSTQDASRDSIGYYAKFVPPLVANGRVYLPSFDDHNGPGNQLLVYGLLPSRPLIDPHKIFVSAAIAAPILVVFFIGLGVLDARSRSRRNGLR